MADVKPYVWPTYDPDNMDEIDKLITANYPAHAYSDPRTPYPVTKQLVKNILAALRINF